MPVAKTIQAQRDFSAGEIDISAKRSDQAQDTTAMLRAGMRQASNFRILNTKALQNRPGRTAMQLASNRVDEITIAPGLAFRFNFTPDTLGTLNIFDTAGNLLQRTTNYTWTVFTIPLITWAVLGKSVYIAAPSIRPLVTTWDGATWSVPAVFVPQVTSGGQRRTFFYRLSQRGISLQPSATTGNITLVFSAAVPGFTALIINSIIRFCGRQILVTGFSNAAALSGTVLETLPPGQTLTVSTDPRTLFNLGDEIIGATSNARGIVTALDATHVTVQLLLTGESTILFQVETVSGPGGSDAVSAVATTVPQSVAIWDDEVMNDFRGWPSSVFSDQSRLGFCNIPALPNAIGWSAITAPQDCYTDALPNSAMLELAPENVQVRYVVPGPESSEFVFCDRRIYYIPITPGNPLKPGSVSFQVLSGDGCAAVQPRAVQEVILYINAGLTSVMSAVATGATNRPYETRNLSELHGHLIKTPIAIAVPTATDQFEERYAYVLNNDGTVAVGKYSVTNGQIVGSVGWLPWNSAGSFAWISARDAIVLFVTSYSGVSVLERINDTVYLDAAMLVNNPPAAFVVIDGRGPLWWLAGQTVDLIDQGARMMGTYQVDGSGFLVPQFRGGENLSAATLMAGKAWTAVAEPFVPAAQPGQDVLQRMRKRRIARAEIYVARSTGFRLDTLKAGEQGPHLPDPGTIIASRRVTAWNQGDDATLPPRLRDQAYAFKPTGRAHDPRIAVVKDTPGPFQLLEFGMEVTV